MNEQISGLHYDRLLQSMVGKCEMKRICRSCPLIFSTKEGREMKLEKVSTMKTTIGLILVSLILFISVGASQSSRTTWEYKLEYKMSEKRANELGAQGWELAGIESTSTAGPGNNVPVYVFKRAR